MNSKSRANYLIKNTTIFAIGSFATKIIIFFLVPLYTYCLSTSEYGLIDLLVTLGTVIVPIFTINISEAIYRFSLDKETQSYKILSISLIVIIFSSIFSLLIIPILSFFPKYENYKIYFYFYLITLSISQLLLVNLKGTEKLKEYTLGNIIHTLLIAIFNIYFLLFFKMGITGYFLANIIANIIVVIYSLLYGKIFKEILHFEFDKKLFYSMAKYSIVLLPTSFMWWIMNSSDRIMVSNMVGNSANGIYAISYKLPSILVTIASIFNQAWMFSAIKEKDSNDKKKYTNTIFSYMYIVLFTISLALIFIIKPFFKIYVSNDFFDAWKYVPILILGSIFMTLASFVSSSYNVYKDSKGFLFSGLLGAFLNLILNLILIPKLQIYGAAIATCLSYILVFIYRIIDTKKYVKIELNKSYVIPVILFILSSCLLFYDNNIVYLFQIIIFLFYIWINKSLILVILKKY